MMTPQEGIGLAKALNLFLRGLFFIAIFIFWDNEVFIDILLNTYAKDIIYSGLFITDFINMSALTYLTFHSPQKVSVADKLLLSISWLMTVMISTGILILLIPSALSVREPFLNDTTLVAGLSTITGSLIVYTGVQYYDLRVNQEKSWREIFTKTIWSLLGIFSILASTFSIAIPAFTAIAARPFTIIGGLCGVLTSISACRDGWLVLDEAKHRAAAIQPVPAPLEEIIIVANEPENALEAVPSATLSLATKASPKPCCHLWTSCHKRDPKRNPLLSKNDDSPLVISIERTSYR